MQQSRPTNMLLRRIDRARQSIRLALTTFCLGYALMAISHLVQGAVRVGAPGALYLLVLLLTWEAVKFAFSGIRTAGRAVVGLKRTA